MANPLDLPGPQFLLFYFALGLAVLAWLHLARRRHEDGQLPKVELSDPYIIAYLRGGTFEAARIGCVSLIERGLLEVDDESMFHTKFDVHGLRMRIEQELVHVFSTRKRASEIFVEPALLTACEGYHETLTRLGLLPDKETAQARRRRLLFALAVLIGLAGAKAYVGLTRGRPIGFLILFTLVFSALAVGMHNPRETARGRALLQDLRRLFARLKERAGTLRPGASPAETALLAAVFGLGALPEERFPWAKSLFPKASRGWNTVSSWGSYCGSSCGGGGCGGGCGGCGGGSG